MNSKQTVSHTKTPYLDKSGARPSNSTGHKTSYTSG